MAKTSTWEALEALERKVRDARAKEDQGRAAHRQALRRVSEAKAALTAHYEEGSEDDAEGRRLIDEIARAEATASKPVSEPRLTAAARVREAAERELKCFEREHRTCCASMRPRPTRRPRTSRRPTARARPHRAATGRRSVRAFRLARIAGREADDVPRHPLSGDVAEVEAAFRSGIEPPLPRALIEAHLGDKEGG